MEKRTRFGRNTVDATKDENSVIFVKKNQQDFEEIRDAIGSEIAARSQSASATAAADPVAQLAQLAALHDAGSITDDKFAQMKARLLEGSK